MLTRLFDDDFPDPSALVHDGYLYLYGTSCHGAPNPNIQVRRTSIEKGSWWEGPWEDMGPAIAHKPVWGRECEVFWAPSKPVWTNGRFRLYYTTDPDECRSKGLGIAVAESCVPYAFTPAPTFLTAGRAYDAIDPHAVVLRNSVMLYWGSNCKPIHRQPLMPNGYEFMPGTRPKCVLKPNGKKYERLIEGFFLEYHAELKSWFAFVSGSNTYDRDDYGVTAYRSKSPFGPFERLGAILGPTEEWWAPGQNCLICVNGAWYFICHAIDPRDPMLPAFPQGPKRVPCAARIAFEDGMPRLERL